MSHENNPADDSRVWAARHLNRASAARPDGSWWKWQDYQGVCYPAGRINCSIGSRKKAGCEKPHPALSSSDKPCFGLWLIGDVDRYVIEEEIAAGIVRHVDDPDAEVGIAEIAGVPRAPPCIG